MRYWNDDKGVLFWVLALLSNYGIAVRVCVHSNGVNVFDDYGVGIRPIEILHKKSSFIFRGESDANTTSGGVRVMSARPWYKRFPGDFISGTALLTFEQKAAYSFLLDLMYLRGGPVPDQPQEISRIMGVSVRKWKGLRADLLVAGKIYEFEGRLSNERVDRELPKNIAEGDVFVKSGRKGGEKRAESCSRVAREFVESCPKSDDKNAENEGVINENKGLDKKGLESKGAENPSSLDTRVYIDKKNKEKEIELWFSDFWRAYPKTVGKSPAKKALEKALKDTPFKTVMAGLKQAMIVWSDAGTETQFIPNAGTWINQRRWEDFEASEPIEEMEAKRERGRKQAKDFKLRLKVQGLLQVSEKWGGGTQEGFATIADELGVDLSVVNKMADKIRVEKTKAAGMVSHG